MNKPTYEKLVEALKALCTSYYAMHNEIHGQECMGKMSKGAVLERVKGFSWQNAVSLDKQITECFGEWECPARDPVGDKLKKIFPEGIVL